MSILNKQTEVIVKLSSEFGFTPGARFRSFSYQRANCMLLVSEQKIADHLAE